jgi:hypothetical protein
MAMNAYEAPEVIQPYDAPEVGPYAPPVPPRPPGWTPMPLPHTATAEEKHLVIPISSQPEKETVDQSPAELSAANPNGRASRRFRALCIPNSGRAYRVFWSVAAAVLVLVGLGIGFGVGFKARPAGASAYVSPC